MQKDSKSLIIYRKVLWQLTVKTLKILVDIPTKGEDSL